MPKRSSDEMHLEVQWLKNQLSATHERIYRLTLIRSAICSMNLATQHPSSVNEIAAAKSAFHVAMDLVNFCLNKEQVAADCQSTEIERLQAQISGSATPTAKAKSKS